MFSASLSLSLLSFLVLGRKTSSKGVTMKFRGKENDVTYRILYVNQMKKKTPLLDITFFSEYIRDRGEARSSSGFQPSNISSRSFQGQKDRQKTLTARVLKIPPAVPLRRKSKR